MEVIKEIEAVEEQLDKAKEMLKDSKKMVKKMVNFDIDNYGKTNFY